MTITGSTHLEEWHFHKPFVIAREIIRSSVLTIVELELDGTIGRGEACPTPHFGETVEGVQASIRAMLAALAGGEDWEALHDRTPPGAARNAVDCAVWDLRAKRSGRSVAALFGQPEPVAVPTTFTLGLDTPQRMAEAAKTASVEFDVLKVKLGQGKDDMARMRAVRDAAPDIRLIVDVNEAWTIDELVAALPELADLGVEMLEQPLAAGRDAALADIDRIVPIGADESCHVAADVEALIDRYDVVNIKLDKTGGLTEAMCLLDTALAHGLSAMVGCMTGTSLAMAPGILVAQRCRFVDLDSPLLLGCDREPRMRYADGQVFPPLRELWG